MQSISSIDHDAHQLVLPLYGQSASVGDAVSVKFTMVRTLKRNLATAKLLLVCMVCVLLCSLPFFWTGLSVPQETKFSAGRGNGIFSQISTSQARPYVGQRLVARKPLFLAEKRKSSPLDDLLIQLPEQSGQLGSKTNHSREVFREVEGSDIDTDSPTPGPLKDISNSSSAAVKILDYNPRDGNVREMRFNMCEYQDCAMTLRSKDAHVIMFNAARMGGLELPQRQPGQIWLMYTREPAAARKLVNLHRRDLTGQINWTYTVLSDSTFRVRYGYLVERPQPDKDYVAIYRQKRFDVAWFVSHCETQSQRENYVKRMTSKVDVHIYGRCGNMTCGDRGYSMGGSKDECLEILSRDYKFYLSFENSMCRDYVSEKFYNMYLDINVVPVVRGGADYNENFESGTFINAADFSSPEDLGKYLYNLSRDEDQYVAMLKKKDRYVKTAKPSPFSCELCRAAHTRSPRHTYPDIGQWMGVERNCWEPRDL